jgi:GNAT superfamily N-acetyltransferase
LPGSEFLALAFEAMPVDITRAGPDRLSVLASLFGRTFVEEPMVRWPLGVHGDVEERFTRLFARFLESLIDLGMVWEAGAAMGAAVWLPADQADAWEDAQTRDSRVHALTDDGGWRYDAYWAWVESKMPDEPAWHLDSVAVQPELRCRGIGAALIDFGLARAHTAGTGACLETGNPRNVPYYERFGFRTATDEDAPDGGPHIWFMRWES